jgi:hypothetical protein
MMKQGIIMIVAGIICKLLLNSCYAQTTSQSEGLQFITSIPMPGVSGRIDHLAYDSLHQLIFVAALGNNSVEVADLQTGQIIQTLKDFEEPQGIAVIPESNAFIVANGGSGACDVFSTETLQKLTSFVLEDDADNIRYDPEDQKIYIGFGEGGIAIVDAITFNVITEVPVAAHPESFQLDKFTGRIYVNVPDEEQVEVIDTACNAVVLTWKLTEARSNFPMALDETGHRLFIGCRYPARLLILDAETGEILSVLDIDSDVDDVFYDSRSAQIFLSCGGGYLDVFKETISNGFIANGKIVTKPGARTSLFIPGLNRFIVAAPAGPDLQAQLLIYQVK